MRSYLFAVIFFSMVLHTHLIGNIVLWHGEVKADGTPTELITLEIDQKYQIKVSGFVNLGKWTQAREKLANDACYEFNREKFTAKINSFQNSNDISVCDGHYHDDHIYLSPVFKSQKNRIHFWIYDNDYDDNSGALDVQILKILDPQ